jgi:predicted dinucleotide-binding enzyme
MVPNDLPNVLVETVIDREANMRIGIVGSGNMAEALGGQWVRAGHEVFVGARSKAKAAALADRIGAVGGGTLGEAVEFGEAVLMAVAFPAVREVLDAVAGALAGKVVIDCTNTFEPPAFAQAVPNGARTIADAAPGAHVVKAFNLCHESVWRRTPVEFDGRPLGVPICGDGGLETAERLVRDLGCEPLYGGGLERAAQLEATAAFIVGLYVTGGDPAGMFPPLEHAGGEPQPLDG